MARTLDELYAEYEKDIAANSTLELQPEKGSMNPQLPTTDYWLITVLGLGLFLSFPPFWSRLSGRRGVQLSSNARWILAGLVIVLMLLLYPPFWHGSQYGSGHRRWHFVLAGHRGHLDMSMLCLEFLVAGVVLGATWYVSTALRDKEEE